MERAHSPGRWPTWLIRESLPARLDAALCHRSLPTGWMQAGESAPLGPLLQVQPRLLWPAVARTARAAPGIVLGADVMRIFLGLCDAAVNASLCKAGAHKSQVALRQQAMHLLWRRLHASQYRHTKAQPRSELNQTAKTAPATLERTATRTCLAKGAVTSEADNMNLHYVLRRR